MSGRPETGGCSTTSAGRPCNRRPLSSVFQPGRVPCHIACRSFLGLGQLQEGCLSLLSVCSRISPSPRVGKGLLLCVCSSIPAAASLGFVSSGTQSWKASMRGLGAQGVGEKGMFCCSVIWSSGMKAHRLALSTFRTRDGI